MLPLGMRRRPSGHRRIAAGDEVPEQQIRGNWRIHNLLGRVHKARAATADCSIRMPEMICSRVGVVM